MLFQHADGPSPVGGFLMNFYAGVCFNPPANPPGKRHLDMLS
jgi:hypothetical protein